MFWFSPNAGDINFSKVSLYIAVAPLGVLGAYWFLTQLIKFSLAVFWLFFLSFIAPPINLANSLLFDVPSNLVKRVAKTEWQYEFEFLFRLLLAVSILGALALMFFSDPFGEALYSRLTSQF